MRCPDDDPGFAEHPVHGAAAQRHILSQVIRHVRAKSVALDVGAHIGTWTVPLAETFKQVIAFEPQPENFLCLRENTAGLANVTLHQVAAAEAPRHAGLGRNDNSGTYWLSGAGDVVVQALDDIVEGPVNFIKLDVEGSEGFALQGATQIISRSHPVVFFEDNGLGEKFYGSAWVDPKDVLRAHGYYHRGRIGKNEIWLPRP